MAVIERRSSYGDWHVVKRIVGLGQAMKWVAQERLVNGGTYRIHFGGRVWIAGTAE